MEQWLQSPPLLQRKVLFTLLLGLGNISIAGVMFFLSKDHTLLLLSIFILAGCIIRSIRLFLVIVRNHYDTLTGTCIDIIAVPFHKYRKIILLDNDGNTTTLLLGKPCQIKPGASYRFYFQRNETAPVGNDYLDTLLSTNTFLGYEEWYPDIAN